MYSMNIAELMNSDLIQLLNMSLGTTIFLSHKSNAALAYCKCIKSPKKSPDNSYQNTFIISCFSTIIFLHPYECYTPVCLPSKQWTNNRS